MASKKKRKHQKKLTMFDVVCVLAEDRCCARGVIEAIAAGGMNGNVEQAFKTLCKTNHSNACFVLENAGLDSEAEDACTVYTDSDYDAIRDRSAKERTKRLRALWPKLEKELRHRVKGLDIVTNRLHFVWASNDAGI